MQEVLTFLIEFILDLIFEVIIRGMINLIRLFGIFGIKVLTFNRKPITEISEDYKDSSKPYFLGVGIFTGIIYMIMRFIIYIL